MSANKSTVTTGAYTIYRMLCQAQCRIGCALIHINNSQNWHNKIDVILSLFIVK